VAGKQLRLGDMLIEAGLITEFQLRSALSDQRQWRRPLGVTLVNLGIVEETDLTRVLSQQLGCDVIDLEGKIVAAEVVALVAYELATEHHCLPLAVNDEEPVGELFLGMFDPTDLNVIDNIGFRTGLRVRAVLVGDHQLSEAIDRSYRKGDVYHKLHEITSDDISPATATEPVRSQADEPSGESKPKTEAPPPQAEAASESESAFLLTDEAPTIMETSSASNSTDPGELLHALIQHLSVRGVIDLDELRTTVETLAADKSN
jgi:hypothetical protein